MKITLFSSIYRFAINFHDLSGWKYSTLIGRFFGWLNLCKIYNKAKLNFSRRKNCIYLPEIRIGNFAITWFFESRKFLFWTTRKSCAQVPFITQIQTSVAQRLAKFYLIVLYLQEISLDLKIFLDQIVLHSIFNKARLILT